MFIEQLNKEDAQNLANWLFEDKEANYCPDNAKIIRNINNYYIFSCGGDQEGEKHELVLFDFNIWDYSICKYPNLDKHYTQFMAKKFGRKYINAYHKHLDNHLKSYITKTEAKIELETEAETNSPQ